MACLGKALYDKKGKAKQIQPPHDNTTAGVNKPVKGESSSKSQQAKYSTPTSTRWTKRLLHHI
jgi:hypothetical protein